VSDLEPGAGEKATEPRKGGDYAPSVAERLSFYQRAGGLVVPLVTAVVAFLIGGLVVLATGHDPIKVYRGILSGTGLDFFIHFGHYHVDVPFTNHHLFFWWDTASNAAFNLQQTLLVSTTLALTALAVAFAFRCGLFNIGGQGQYVVGGITGVWVGSSFVRMDSVAHVLLAIVVAMAAGAAWGAIAGFLKATVGAHEVITTIMLNWIAYWIGSYAFGQGGPLQNTVSRSVPISSDIAPGAHLPVWWGDPQLQGLHIGFFISILSLIVFWLILNRTTLGYEVRAVGFNPEAARYGGISPARNYIVTMAISGLFAGLAGAMDVLGYLFRLGVLDIQVSQVGFIGIAVALLGRNTAVGIALASLLFGGLLYGTSSRSPSLGPDVFPTQLAGNLTLIIQGLVLLFVGADVLILYLWQLRKKVRPRSATPSEAAEAASV
jgi:general nucleoside transport system permease protein